MTRIRKFEASNTKFSLVNVLNYEKDTIKYVDSRELPKKLVVSVISLVSRDLSPVLLILLSDDLETFQVCLDAIVAIVK